MEFKVYTTDKKHLKAIADKYDVELEYLKHGYGEGYVSNGEYLRVFCKHSYADTSESIVVLSGYEKRWVL